MLSERQRGAVSETRKITKSAMEKKRRARINTSLVELKSILAGMISHKSERFEKMEKADILEMTVKYVKQLQRSSEKLSDTNKPKDEQYKNGVNNCISEVIKYIASSDTCDTEIKSKLLDHLANRLSGVDNVSKAVQREHVSPVKQTHSDTVPNNEPDRSKLSPVPLTVNTSTVCPPVLTTSPGGQQNQLAVQGQYTALQTSPMMSNIPLTIIVPANFYTSTHGATCVIPLSIPACASKQVQLSPDLPNGLSNTIPGLPCRTPEAPTSTCNNQQSPSFTENATNVNNINCNTISSTDTEQTVTDRRSSIDVRPEMPHIINTQRPKKLGQPCSPRIQNFSEQPPSSPDCLWRPWSRNDL